MVERRSVTADRLLPDEVSELLRRVWVTMRAFEDCLHGLVLDCSVGRGEASGDERGELGWIDRAELELLGTAPEGLVRVVEDPLHEVALAPEVNVRHLRLCLEDCPHEPRVVAIDRRDLLELVENK